ARDHVVARGLGVGDGRVLQRDLVRDVELLPELVTRRPICDRRPLGRTAVPTATGARDLTGGGWRAGLLARRVAGRRVAHDGAVHPRDVVMAAADGEVDECRTDRECGKQPAQVPAKCSLVRGHGNAPSPDPKNSQSVQVAWGQFVSAVTLRQATAHLQEYFAR